MKTAVSILFLLAAGATQALQLSPVAGYELRSRELKEFAEFRRGASCKQPSCKLKAQMDQDRFRIEGRVERLQMHHHSGSKVSPLQVAREYQAVLQRAGGELMNPESGENGAFVFRVPEGKAATWVVLDDNFDGYYTLYLITPQAREATVQLQAAELDAALKAEGVATVYIEFDTGRAALKPEGVAAVAEIHKLLQQQPALKLSIEGHTDNVGEVAANRRLSLERARAVTAALTAQGVAAARLSAKGHGADVPVADNRKDEGRAKNRRVELVRLP